MLPSALGIVTRMGGGAKRFRPAKQRWKTRSFRRKGSAQEVLPLLRLFTFWKSTTSRGICPSAVGQRY